MRTEGRTRPTGLLLRTAVLVTALLLLSATLGQPQAQAATTAPLTLSPASGPVGTVVVVKGTGFPRRASGTVTFDGTAVASFQTTKRGVLSISFSVPSGAARSVLVQARTSTTTGTAAFAVTAPAPAPGPAPDPVSSVVPPAGGYFGLRPVGAWSSLPDDAAAAAQVRRSTWEPRPQNAKANSTVPSSLSVGPHGGVAPIWNSWLLPRVTGNFTGTTDEIVQWAALKWGLPDEVLRGQMITESYWYQGLLDANGAPINGKGFGDFTTDQAKCPPGYVAPCPMSFGVLQSKASAAHPGVFPYNRDSTAFNLDYVAAIMRGCYEGWETWLSKWGTAQNSYGAGDLYGCIGRWYSGQWHTTLAEPYIAKVKNNTAARAWATSGF